MVKWMYDKEKLYTHITENAIFFVRSYENMLLRVTENDFLKNSSFPYVIYYNYNT